MTNQEINERIARLCGWERKVRLLDSNVWNLERIDWVSPKQVTRYAPPNYAESLDACRAFEELIKNSTEYDIRDYIINLEDASKARGSGWDWRSFQLTTATPRQRCEAVLRLKGQWDEN